MHLARALLIALLLATGASSARGNGALPATTQILLPPSAPDTFIVGTNFGLVTSTDRGATWQWICEHGAGNLGSSYQLGAGPEQPVLALAVDGIALTRSLGCTWSSALEEKDLLAVDYFPDPNDGNRLMVIAFLLAAPGGYALLEVTLTENAKSTVRQLYAPPNGEVLRTVEIARSNPKVIYATVIAFEGTTRTARIARTEDGGITWTLTSPAPAQPDLGILAIDPGNADTVYLRSITNNGDRLMVSLDGGKTLRNALDPFLVMSSFVRLDNGHFVVGWRDLHRGFIYRSTDQAATFTRLPPTFQPLALAQRDGHLYATSDISTNKFALAVSDDEGETWTQTLALQDVSATAACPNALDLCSAVCDRLQPASIFNPQVCTTAAGAPDAGDRDAAAEANDDATGDSPVGRDEDVPAAAPDAGADGAAGPASKAGGCSCAIIAGRTRRPDTWSLLIAVSLTAIMLRRRRW